MNINRMWDMYRQYIEGTGIHLTIEEFKDKISGYDSVPGLSPRYMLRQHRKKSYSIWVRDSNG